MRSGILAHSDRHNKFGPAQTFLVPVEGQGTNILLYENLRNILAVFWILEDFLAVYFTMGILYSRNSWEIPLFTPLISVAVYFSHQKFLNNTAIMFHPLTKYQFSLLAKTDGDRILAGFLQYFKQYFFRNSNWKKHITVVNRTFLDMEISFQNLSPWFPMINGHFHCFGTYVLTWLRLFLNILGHQFL